MQSERIAEASALSGKVRGLGVCDALRLELLPEQLPQLIEQAEAARVALQEEIRQRTNAMVPEDPRGIEQLEAAQYELRLLERLRAQLPTGEVRGSFVVVGPTDVVGAIVRDSTRRVVETLGELVLEHPGSGCEARAGMVAAVTAAAAWVQTYVDAQAIEDFSFDVEADPSGPNLE
jgi:hypothetical protein